MSFDYSKMFQLMQVIIIQANASISLIGVQTYGEEYYEQDISIYENYKQQLDETEIMVYYQYPETKQLQSFLSNPNMTSKYIIMETKGDKEKQITIFKLKKK